MAIPLGQKPPVDEEDDLDDLDDVLDQFQAPPSPQPTSTSASASASTSTLQQLEPDADKMSSEDFAAAFAKEMESMLKDLGVDPSASGGDDDAAELAKAWEAMLVEGMDAMAGPSNPSPEPKEDDFQSRIRSTMNKLKESESDLKASDASATAGGDGFESLLSQLQDLGGLAGDGEQSEEQLQRVLENMMGQLISKDVLYEPLKELQNKFPDYIAKNAMSPEDKTRFEAQIECIGKLLNEFEADTYSDDDEKTRERIVALMGELQTHGSPPEEIMGPLPPGFSLGADGLPNMPDGCNVN